MTIRQTLAAASAAALPEREQRVPLPATDDCGSTPVRAALTLFDPVARDEVVLTQLDPDEQWREVFLATEARAWIW